MNKLNVWWWRKYVHSFQVAPLKSLINCEGGKSQFPVEKPGSTALITRSQRRRPASNKAHRNRGAGESTQPHTCDVPDQHQATANRPILKGTLQNKWLATVENIKVRKVQGSLRHCFRRNWIFFYPDYYWDDWQSWGLENSIVTDVPYVRQLVRHLRQGEQRDWGPTVTLPSPPLDGCSVVMSGKSL